MKYDTPQKAHYRKVVWDVLSRDEEVPGPIFILDTGACLETAYLVDRGYAQDAIHVCNQQAADVAAIKRRFADVHTYGVDAGRAFMRMKADGISVETANLDFCGNISREILQQLHDIGHSGVLRDAGNEWGTASVAVTLLSGRESPAIMRTLTAISPHARIALGGADDADAVTRLSDSDASRLAIAITAMGMEPHIRETWKYLSPSRQPMLVAAVELGPDDEWRKPPRWGKNDDMNRIARSSWLRRDGGRLARCFIRHHVDEILMSRATFAVAM